MTSSPASLTGRSRWRWFPVVWAFLLGGAALCFQLQDFDRGLKTVACTGLGMLFMLGLLTWFTLCSRFSRRVRWGTFIAFWAGVFVLYNSIDLIKDGDIRVVGWRFVWEPKPDELLAVPDVVTVIDDWQPTEQDFPRFLGGGSWPEVLGVDLETDWEAHPPVEVWRKEIGAGWSSFAIVGDYAVTQEQRGEMELVVCYRVSTGDIVWTHGDKARFDPTTLGGGMGDAGPRATPTISGQRVFTQGATGIVNCLDATTGQLVWSHDVHQEQGADNLIWAKSGSPLVVNDIVVISVGSPTDEKKRESYSSSLVAYDIETGEVRWTAGNRITSYASPVPVTLAGVPQILQINENFLTAHRASDGEILWEHDWPGNSSADASCCQPVPVGDDRVFLSNGDGKGASLLKVTSHETGTSLGEFQVTPLWQPAVKKVMKTAFSNVVIRNGYVYGISDVMLQCVELETGRKMWNKRRSPAFGHGQIMLIGDTILILSEIGELALVACTPDAYKELATLQVFEPSDVTWNNPAFSAPYLLVRNAREAVCYRLAVVE